MVDNKTGSSNLDTELSQAGTNNPQTINNRYNVIKHLRQGEWHSRQAKM